MVCHHQEPQRATPIDRPIPGLRMLLADHSRRLDTVYWFLILRQLWFKIHKSLRLSITYMTHFQFMSVLL